MPTLTSPRTRNTRPFKGSTGFVLSSLSPLLFSFPFPLSHLLPRTYSHTLSLSLSFDKTSFLPCAYNSAKHSLLTCSTSAAGSSVLLFVSVCSPPRPGASASPSRALAPSAKPAGSSRILWSSSQCFCWAGGRRLTYRSSASCACTTSRARCQFLNPVARHRFETHCIHAHTIY